MAVQGKQRPHQPNKTPPPNSRVGYVNQGDYGANGFAGRSSVDPGQTVTSPVADNLRQNQDDGQDVLGKVIAKGVSNRSDSVSDFQERTISAKPYPTTHGMKGASVGPKIPGAILGGQADPVRKPE